MKNIVLGRKCYGLRQKTSWRKLTQTKTVNKHNISWNFDARVKLGAKGNRKLDCLWQKAELKHVLQIVIKGHSWLFNSLLAEAHYPYKSISSLDLPFSGLILYQKEKVVSLLELFSYPCLPFYSPYVHILIKNKDITSSKRSGNRLPRDWILFQYYERNQHAQKEAERATEAFSFMIGFNVSLCCLLYICLNLLCQ